MKLRGLAALSAASLLALAGPANAATILFDFEDAQLGTQNSLTQTKDGVTLTLTRANGSAFDVSDISGNPLAPSDFGKRTIGGFNNLNGAAFILNFSTAVDRITLKAGSFGQGPDSYSFKAFSGLNGVGDDLGGASGSRAGDNGFPQTNTLNFAGFDPLRSITLLGGNTAGNGTVFFDNVQVITSPISGAVPEPGTWAMMLLGFFAVGAALRVSPAQQTRTRVRYV